MNLKDVKGKVPSMPNVSGKIPSLPKGMPAPANSAVSRQPGGRGPGPCDRAGRHRRRPADPSAQAGAPWVGRKAARQRGTQLS